MSRGCDTNFCADRQFSAVAREYYANSSVFECIVQKKKNVNKKKYPTCTVLLLYCFRCDGIARRVIDIVRRTDGLFRFCTKCRANTEITATVLLPKYFLIESTKKKKKTSKNSKITKRIRQKNKKKNPINAKRLPRTGYYYNIVFIVIIILRTGLYFYIGMRRLKLY